MKKRIILVAALCYIGCVAAESKTNPTIIIEVNAGWVKTTTGIWESLIDGKHLFYKINATDGSLWSSTDNAKWEAVKTGTWSDKNGNFLKVANNELLVSADGKNWEIANDAQWESTNGLFYRFDKDMILWTRSTRM